MHLPGTDKRLKNKITNHKQGNMEWLSVILGLPIIAIIASMGWGKPGRDANQVYPECKGSPLKPTNRVKLPVTKHPSGWLHSCTYQSRCLHKTTACPASLQHSDCLTGRGANANTVPLLPSESLHWLSYPSRQRARGFLKRSPIKAATTPHVTLLTWSDENRCFEHDAGTGKGRRQVQEKTVKVNVKKARA
jgi:hypothetical protein